MTDEVAQLAGMLELVTHALEQERATNAAMREIVEAVARGEFSDSGWNNAGYCRCDPDLIEDEETGCYETVHQPHCMLTKACAILAAEQETGQ